MFQVTTKNLYNLKKTEDGKIDYSDDFFGKQTSLTVSGQLEGELGATALGAIYTFGPTFRAENSNTPRHLAEFWMVEPEVAFLDMDGLMELEEDFIKYCIRWALEHCKDDLAFLNKMIDKGLIARLEGVLNSDFVHLPYTEGIRILQEAIANGKKFEFPCEWGDDLASEHERFLVEEHFKRPVIMTNYPKAIKAFYMKIDEEESGFGGKSGQTVQGTDVLFPQIGEIIGGSVREESYDKLMGEIEARNIPMKDMNWYLDTRKYGSCPHAGFGLGFERLILFVTGMQNIQQACQILGITLIRYERPSASGVTTHPLLHSVSSLEEACQLAAQFGKRALLTTGSKDLARFQQFLPEKHLIARVLPTAEVIAQCEALGLGVDQIIAMKGPFSADLNRALYQFCQPDVVITKESGQEGGFQEKIAPCIDAGIPCIVIERPQSDAAIYGAVCHSFDEILTLLTRFQTREPA
jgi:precorrin-6x reductase